MIITMSFLFNIVVAVCVFIPLSTSLNPFQDIVKSQEHFSARPIEGNYTPTGTTITFNNMTIYETANGTNTRVLILAYDALAYSDNLKQVADKMAEGFGFKIIIPDYFRVPVPWNLTTWPTVPQEIADAFFAEHGNWTVTAKEDTLNIMDHYRAAAQKVEFGIFGFCWGGYASTQAATDIPELRAAGLVHPTYVFNEEAEGVQVPMYLLPSQTETNMLPFYITLQRKFGTNCGHRRFDDMRHAFAGGGGNFSDPLTALRVNEVIEILGTFFDRNIDK